MSKNTTKSGLLKARCEPHIESDYDWFAEKDGLDTADIVRRALSKFYHEVIAPAKAAAQNYGQRNS